MRIRNRLIAGTALAVFSLPVIAHPGGAPGHDLWAGIVHPVSGLDHLAMLLLLGLWLWRGGERWCLAVPLLAGLTAGVLFAGGALPMAVIEGLVMASLPVAAAAAVYRRTGPAAVALLSGGLFAHGQAHGLALGALAATPAFVLGLALGSLAVMVLAGILAGKLRLASGLMNGIAPGDRRP